jgi:uncharacterized membrane protein YeaQ/YmgE (transglycosylase-associated protein family)
MAMHFLWVILIGLIAGIIAKVSGEKNEPKGFILTTVLGIVGALVACPFRKFHPAWIRIIRQNHRILISDACDPACARNACR